MVITRQQFVAVLSIALLYLVGQLFTGTQATVAALFSVAILFGTLSIFAGGGLRSFFGCLNAILIGKFLLFGVALKLILLEPSDGTLSSPGTTASVMALGFAGVFVGTTIQSYLPCPQSWSLNRPFSTRMLLSFSIVVFLASYLGYFLSLISSAQGEGLQTGGWLGIARTLASLKSFAIVPPLLYLWRKNTRYWLTHPVIVALLVWSAIIGIFSTSKQDAIEPFIFYVLVGFLRYGFRDRRLWSLASLGLVYYALIIFPYSQYVRHNGGREGSLSQRAEAITETFWRVISDGDFRTTTTERASQTSYFNQGSLSPFNRIAMVGEADRLISATESQQAFTGWETIAWGFKLLTPSFLFPDKPVFEATNYMAHIVGEVSPSDTTTQVSYGIMANFYNAFSLTGVFLGTTLFFAGFYYWIRLFLGEPRWDGTPSTSSLWFIWLAASFQHRIVESSVSGIVASLSFPLVLAVLCMAAKWLCGNFPRKLTLYESFANQQL